MAFHEVRFPPKLSFGSVGGPERRTEIVTLASGHEERNTPWAQARRRFDAGVGLRSLDDLAELIAFFEARQGQLHGFRWKDWADFTSGRPSDAPDFRDQDIAVGDGATRVFHLTKRYVSGAQAQTRPIAKPVSGTVRLGLSGEQLTEGPDFALDAATGEVTLAVAPPQGARLTAGFAFDVPVRFDADRIDVSVASFRAGEVPRVPVVEIRL